MPSVDDIRRAVFDLLRGADRYEIVDANGEVLTIASAEELSIGSMDQLLRKAATTPQVDKRGAGHDGPPGTSTLIPTPKTGADYRRYVLEVPNRSLVDLDARRSIANLLQAVLDAVDPDTGGDVQLVDIRVSVTADPAAVGEVGDRASTAGAKWREEELDF